MSGSKVSIGQLSDTVMKELENYAQSATEIVKDAVDKAGKTVKNEIKANAPVRTGRYAKSWTVKKLKDDSHSKTIVVYSKDRYQVAHLLEKGHAKRNGGRVPGHPHIEPAEQKGNEQLENDIKRGLSNG